MYDSIPTITVFIYSNLVYTDQEAERSEAGTGTELILQVKPKC
jgi:hypothetical protein